MSMLIFAGSKLDDGPSTPLPDKKLLLFVLDRLQKYVLLVPIRFQLAFLVCLSLTVLWVD